MYISTNRSGCASLKISAKVELETSPSRTTTSPASAPSAASASPYALRVETALPTSYAGHDAPSPVSKRCELPGLRLRDVDHGGCGRRPSPRPPPRGSPCRASRSRSRPSSSPCPSPCARRSPSAVPVVDLGLAVGGVDCLDVVAVDLDRVPAERLEPARVRGEVPAVHRLAALAEPVDVDDRGEVVELVEGARAPPPPTSTPRPSRCRRRSPRRGTGGG